eukprot:CAMPEP_0202705198 /NCGR_PEP_ID=MMETSP1385-20130828/17780_1 /ASSEMBLY_ACC=CAM_ASM_000861 /TAXON_ID=933848 /ORGANISM="Elphidium margaritaceum" /LENGTH=453 /DNA_ID=CAMNT_0049363383 /DNA_START=41 /DNA_END=1402 /DNA_ORIENTATION=-
MTRATRPTRPKTNNRQKQHWQHNASNNKRKMKTFKKKSKSSKPGTTDNSNTKNKQELKLQLHNVKVSNLILAKQNEFHKFQGSALFRWRLLLSTLTHRSICIDNIRIGDDKPGLTDYEMSFLQLLDKITNGSIIEINESATKVRYKPGALIGSSSIIHFKCCTSRSVAYWMEPLFILLLFCKEQQTSITLYGATYHELDISMDQIRSVLKPILNKHFGCIDIRIDLKTRALSPSGGGEVRLTVPSVSTLKTLHLTEPGMIKRIRGLCYTVSMAPTLSNRVRGACNDLLYNYIPDVWIFNDKTTRSDIIRNINKLNNTHESNIDVSAGYGLTLIAESTNDVLLSVHQLNQNQFDPPMTAEEFGTYVGKLLLEEISYGGTVDTCLQSFVLLCMALCTEDVSKVRLGRMSKHTVNMLRLLKDLLGVTFKIKEDPETGTIFASCMGVGYTNIWKQAS